jgi:hypothetical protein
MHFVKKRHFRPVADVRQFIGHIGKSSFNDCGEPGIKRGLTQPVFMN